MVPRKETVAGICAYLGYPSDSNKDERYRGKLSNPMRDFCKSFQDSLTRPVDFSSPKGLDTLDCATAFAAKNQHLFPDEKIAWERRWPVYHHHRIRIRNGLARLISCQNNYKKKKINSKNAKMAKNAEHPSLPENPPNASGRINTLPTETERVVSGDASPRKKDMLQSEDIIHHEALEHLKFIYPQTEPVKSSSGDWLLGFGAQCPPDIKVYAFRYLHDNDLYDSDNKAEIRKMVCHMKMEFKVGESGMDDQMIFTRCAGIIRRAVKMWRDDGLFEGYSFLTRSKRGSDHDTWVKTAVFESEWRARRARWLARNEAAKNNTEKSSPTTNSTEDIPRSPRSPKRVAQSSDDESDVDLFAASKYRETKRRRSDSDRSRSIVSSPPLPDIPRKEDAFPSMNSPIPDRVPSARMYTPMNSTPAKNQSIVRSMSTELAIRSSPAQPRGPTKENAPAVYPNSSSGPQRPEVAQAAPSGLGLEGIPSNRITTSGPASAPQDRTTALSVNNASTSEEATPTGLGLRRIPSNMVPTSGPVSSPRNQTIALPPSNGAASEVNSRRPLWFALPGPTGDPDISSDKLVSIATFKKSSRSDFFKLVATRAGESHVDLGFITLRCGWAPRLPIVVSRFWTVEMWTDMQDDIIERYHMEQAENPSREKFRVWVRCGNTSNLEEE